MGVCVRVCLHISTCVCVCVVRVGVGKKGCSVLACAKVGLLPGWHPQGQCTADLLQPLLPSQPTRPAMLPCCQGIADPPRPAVCPAHQANSSGQLIRSALLAGCLICFCLPASLNSTCPPACQLEQHLPFCLPDQHPLVCVSACQPDLHLPAYLPACWLCTSSSTAWWHPSRPPCC